MTRPSTPALSSSSNMLAQVEEACQAPAHVVVKRRLQTRNANVLELRGHQYVSAWLGVVGLHCVCAVYLTQVARLYSFLAHPYMEYWVALIARENHSYYRQVGWGFGALAALYYYELLIILCASVRARELVLLDDSFSFTQLLGRVARKLAAQRWRVLRIATVDISAKLEPLALPTRLARRAYRAVFSRRGILSAESAFFPLVFTLREAVEVVSQTFQAHRSSESLPRPWLNNLFVMLVVVNCWSTPVLQRLLRHHQGLERVVCLLCDAVINLGSSLVIPLVVFTPYYHAFLPAYWTFPLESIYDTLFFSRLITENTLLFSLAPADVVSRMVPHIGIYSSLTSVATLIRRRDSRRAAQAVSPTTSVGSTTHIRDADAASALALSSVPKRLAIAVDLVVAVSSRSQRFITRVARSKTSLLVHCAFVLWGLSVLALHLRATVRMRKRVTGCRQVVGSWLATDYPCSVYTYNCYCHNTTSPDDASWPRLDATTLLYLTIAHCTALTVPSRIQSYANLLGFQLHNTTLVEWSKASAISETTHRQMLVVLIGRTNMSAIPDGLLEPLPATLTDIEITHSNLSALPLDLHTKWHAMATLYLEHLELTAFPPTLVELETTELSLFGNRIAHVPELAAVRQRYLWFVLSANPLTELPETLHEDTAFAYVSVERTQLAALPAWTHTRVEDTMYLAATPYCDAEQQQSESESSSHVQRTSAVITCTARDANGKAPIAIFDALNPLDQD